jgi:hypothetical protein
MSTFSALFWNQLQSINDHKFKLEEASWSWAISFDDYFPIYVQSNQEFPFLIRNASLNVKGLEIFIQTTRSTHMHPTTSLKHLITHLSSGKLLSTITAKDFHHQSDDDDGYRPINHFILCVFMLHITWLSLGCWSVIHNMKAANVAFNPL